MNNYKENLLTNVFGERYFIFDGRPIYHNSLTLMLSGCAIAGALSNGEIAVDDRFFELSDEAQNFILYHEIGHLEHGHHKDLTTRKCMMIIMTRLVCNKIGGVIKMERQADEYAAKRTGKDVAIKALKEINVILAEITGKESKEVYSRIKNIKRKF